MPNDTRPIAKDPSITRPSMDNEAGQASPGSSFNIAITFKDTVARPLSYWVGSKPKGSKFSIAASGSNAGQVMVGDSSQQSVPLAVPFIYDGDQLADVYVSGLAGDTFFIINGEFNSGTTVLGAGGAIYYGGGGAP